MKTPELRKLLLFLTGTENPLHLTVREELLIEQFSKYLSEQLKSKNEEIDELRKSVDRSNGNICA